MLCKLAKKIESIPEVWARILDYNPGCAPKDNYQYILRQLQDNYGFIHIRVLNECNLGCGPDAPYKAIYVEINELKRRLREPIIIKYYYGDGAFPNDRNIDWIIKGDASKTAPYYLTFIIRPDKLP